MNEWKGADCACLCYAINQIIQQCIEAIPREHSTSLDGAVAKSSGWLVMTSYLGKATTQSGLLKNQWESVRRRPPLLSQPHVITNKTYLLTAHRAEVWVQDNILEHYLDILKKRSRNDNTVGHVIYVCFAHRWRRHGQIRQEGHGTPSASIRCSSG